MPNISGRSPEKIPESHAAHERSRSVESPKVAKSEGREYEIIAKSINILHRLCQRIMNALSLKGFSTDREILIKKKLTALNDDLARVGTQLQWPLKINDATLSMLHHLTGEIEENALIMEEFAPDEVQKIQNELGIIKENVRNVALDRLAKMNTNMKTLINSVIDPSKYKRIAPKNRFTKDELDQLITLNRTLTSDRMKTETINQAVNVIKGAFERNKLEFEKNDLESMNNMEEFLPQFEAAAKPIIREATHPRARNVSKGEQKDE